ncbi:nucleotidyltransferase domain-containing protein [Gorillibacterium sp. sgz500922]|uniref:nucleotidyltransferase domain-containing protein n=1 Tax=Gorillibacterium sp. sgz500922 TaxID=3446694 RepID=UPI003F67F7EE
MNRLELSLERQLVLLASVEVEEADRPHLTELLDATLDWSEILYQMTTHRTLNMLTYNLKKFGLFEPLEGELKRLLNLQWAAYRERNGSYAAKLAETLRAFAEKNVVLPVLKGNLLVNTVYPSLETRTFNDLDFLMQLEDVNAVTEALEGLGYIQGEYDAEAHEIKASSRKAKMVHQMTTHEIQEFIQLTDHPFAPVVEVDVNHDILWRGNCPYKVPTRELIARAVPIELYGERGYRLDHADNLIQLCCHLYKEAVLMVWISSLKDLKLYKFADLYMYIRKFSSEIDWDGFQDRVRHYGLEKVVYYNLHYLQLLFRDIVPEAVREAFRPDDLAYLDQYAIENETPSVWEYDFFTRLFDVNRILSVEEGTAEGFKRFQAVKSS